MSIAPAARHIWTTAIVIAIGAGAWAHLARSPSCDELRDERNSIYKMAGYCFTDERAIARFGNEGCHVKDMRDARISAENGVRLMGIAAAEEKACRG